MSEATTDTGQTAPGQAPVDIAELEATLDVEGARMLSEAFLEDTVDMTEAICQALIKRDQEGLRKVAHALRGCCRSIMARDTERLSAHLERSAMQADWDASDRNFAALKQSYQLTADYLRRYLA